MGRFLPGMLFYGGADHKALGARVSISSLESQGCLIEAGGDSRPLRINNLKIDFFSEATFS